MKLQKIVIENFRSYYGTNIINIGEGLTLLIGSNGDGKTTLYDALDWLFDNNRISDSSKLVSEKKHSEMMDGEVATVRVSIEFEHNDKRMLLERSFTFKSYGKNIEPDNAVCVLYEERGSERVKIANGAERFNKFIFDQNIRRYCMFKGESELNVFNGPQALENLIETFSDVKQFDPYVNFCKEASEQAELATNRALTSNRKIEATAKTLIREMEDLKIEISKLDTQLKIKRKDSAESSAYLEDLEKNKESSAQLKDINGKLSNLYQERDNNARRLKENYTIRLLDEMWILMGFEPIAKEFSAKIASYDKAKRKLENEFQREQGAKNYQQQLINGSVPLAPYVPDEKTMREMLHDHICKVCNREAPEGSDAYEFMKKRLNDYLESLKNSDQEETLFKFQYINELAKRDNILNNEMDYIVSMMQSVIDGVELNQRFKAEGAKIEAAIARWEEEKKQLLAQVPGLTEDQLMNEYNSITNWWNVKHDADLSIANLENQIKELNTELEKKLSEYDKLAEQSPAAIYSLTQQALRKIWKAFEDAKQRNRQEFLDRLENESNSYLEMLNKNDFRGIIRLLPMQDGKIKTILKDENDVVIANPNTALSTTMYMSILFAVAKLTTLQRNNDYPLIFDAPTSSFTEAKEADFFKIIGDINKQVIIVTKSFLQSDEEKGTQTLDMSKLKDINGLIYRMAKKEPFEEKILSTIQTVITKIK